MSQDKETMLAKVERIFAAAPDPLDDLIIEHEDLIHDFFGLTYANYLVLRRSVLQSAPVWWQRKWIKLIRQLQEMFPDDVIDGDFVVQLRDERGRFIGDPVPAYNRGRTRIELRPGYLFTEVDPDPDQRPVMVQAARPEPMSLERAVEILNDHKFQTQHMKDLADGSFDPWQVTHDGEQHWVECRHPGLVHAQILTDRDAIHRARQLVRRSARKAARGESK